MKVYCLYEIKTLKIRYIGITSQSLIKRLYQHFYFKSKNSYKENWIRKNNNQIDIRLIKEFSNKCDARNLELYLIRKYKDSHNLVNLEDRGFCGDKKILSKNRCEQISKTLKEKYKNNILLISGEKKVYVWNNKGELLYNFSNAKKCSKFLNIPYSKIGTICNKGSYYKNYTFTRENKLPIERYIKCYDFLKQELKLCFKKQDIHKVLKIEKFHFKNINNNKLYLKRYNVRTDNIYPNILNKYCAWYKFGELLETPEGFKTKEELETINLNV